MADETTEIPPEPAKDPLITRQTKPIWIAIGAIVLFLLLSVAFCLGRATNDRGDHPFVQMGGGQGPAMERGPQMHDKAERGDVVRRGGAVVGTVESVDGSTVTITVPEGTQLEDGQRVGILGSAP